MKFIKEFGPYVAFLCLIYTCNTYYDHWQLKKYTTGKHEMRVATNTPTIPAYFECKGSPKYSFTCMIKERVGHYVKNIHMEDGEIDTETDFYIYYCNRSKIRIEIITSWKPLIHVLDMYVIDELTQARFDTTFNFSQDINLLSSKDWVCENLGPWIKNAQSIQPKFFGDE